MLSVYLSIYLSIYLPTYLSISFPYPHQFATPDTLVRHQASKKYNWKTVVLADSSQLEIARREFRALLLVGLIPMIYLPTELICPGSNHLLHNLPSFLSRLVSNPQKVRTESSFGVTEWVSSCASSGCCVQNNEAALSLAGKQAFIEQWCLLWRGEG